MRVRFRFLRQSWCHGKGLERSSKAWAMALPSLNFAVCLKIGGSCEGENKPCIVLHMCGNIMG